MKSSNKYFPQQMDIESRNQSSQAKPASEEEFPKAAMQVSGKSLKEIITRHTIKASAYPNIHSLF